MQLFLSEFNFYDWLQNRLKYSGIIPCKAAFGLLVLAPFV